MTQNQKYNEKHIVVAIVLVGVSLMLTWFYRPFIYTNDFFDFHFADTIGSLFCVPAATFFFRGISNNHSYNKLILLSVIAFFIYEFLSLFDFFFWGTFDVYDLIAIIIGALITFGIGRLFKIK